ncbi:MAG: hypothetical protein U1B80_06895 [Anaerolineaceae bacterium]|nr:hypothetical protein [Anaerolineaceae bacterium]
MIVQLLFGASVPPEKAMADAPATAVKVGVPQPLVVAPAGFATTIAPGEVGNASVKFSPLIVTGFGLVNVKVSAETPPALVGFGLNFFVMVAEVGSMMAAIRLPTEKSAL